MQQPRLDYAGPTHPAKSLVQRVLGRALAIATKRPWPVIAAAALLALLFVPGARVGQDLGWIDSISGSRKTQTIWRVGASSLPMVSDSPLAVRYRKLGLKWEADWKNVKGTYINIFGGGLGSAHGWPAPEIYSFPRELQQYYLAAASDDDIRTFFHVMLHGTEAEKKAMLEAAGEKAMSQ